MKTITVFGATGVQGGSVIKRLLEHSEIIPYQFKIRAITRDKSKPAAQQLESRGVEIVEADLDDTSSLTKALQNSNIVFAVTNYWEKQSKTGEIEQGTRLADVCKAVNVDHLIWSALPYVTKITDGKLRAVEHFDSKAAVAEYIEGMKGEMTATYIMPGFYMQNIKRMIGLNQDGEPVLAVPWDGQKTKVALLDAATDMGLFVSGILGQPKARVNGMYVQACSDWISPDELVRILNEEADGRVSFKSVDANSFRNGLPPAVAEEMTENMLLVRDYSYYGVGSREAQGTSDQLLKGSKKVSWRDYVRANGPWTWSTTVPDLYNRL